MKEFVYLPERSERGQTPELMIKQVSAKVGTLGISDRAQAYTGTAPLGMDSDTVPLSASPGLEELTPLPFSVLNWIPQSGAAQVVLNVGEDEKPPEIDGGAFYPIVEYEPATPLRVRVGRRAIDLSEGPYDEDLFRLRIVLKPRVRGKPKPLVGAIVNLRPKYRQTLRAVTDQNGNAVFALRASELYQASLVVETGFNNHWGHLVKSVDLTSGDEIAVEPVDLYARPCGLRMLSGAHPSPAGEGVKIAILDSGVGPHNDLVVNGDDDNSTGHGTHIAGIIAGRGSGPYGGLAPNAEILSFRVFNDRKTGKAKNFDIHEAIFSALDAGCHLINLSLRVDRSDEEVVGRALKVAADEGVLCFGAAGNDRARLPIAFPARHQDCISVAALGHVDGMPDNAFDRWTVSATRSKADNDLFFGSFSNKGDRQNAIDLIAPGAGIISTVPGGGYSPMSGTSMACPAALGAAAKLLSTRPNLLNAPPTRDRRDQMWEFIKSHCRSVGFSTMHEGLGMIDY